MRTIEGSADHVVVIGAGLAGLSAALHLAGRGRAVTVVEREAWPGGRAGRRDIDGYQIDTGPTVLTMPDIIEDTFRPSATPWPGDWSCARWIPRTAPCSPTAAASTSTASRTGWPTPSPSSPAASRRRATGGCGHG
ncbi:hypothetical protein JPH1_38600 [Mycobacterium avium subsp. hominissuis]|uniref:FAD binding domain protein n=1 Tax=Mycobacterium avium subsp. hominissuis TaxID=439334 RepID=A0AAI8SPT6_MYCAV|nr:hypothetical protein JPH1_38600 [Mycobacterium avium subsp. hominissuis]